MSMPIKIYSKKRRDNIMPIRVQNDLPVKEIQEEKGDKDNADSSTK